MTREHFVRVATANGGAATFVGGQQRGLKVAAGETAERWEPIGKEEQGKGKLIARAEFDNILAPTKLFVIAEEYEAPDSEAASEVETEPGDEPEKE